MMFGHKLKLKSRLYQLGPLTMMSETHSGSSEVTTAVGYLFNGQFYPTETAAQKARIEFKIRELLSIEFRADISYSGRTYDEREGWDKAISFLLTKLPELNRIINS